MLNLSAAPNFNRPFARTACWSQAQATRRTAAVATPADQSASRRQLAQGWSDFAGRPRVAVIDDFNGSHGKSMANAIRMAGADALEVNVAEGAKKRTTSIADALQNLSARLDRGERIDAVNLSQQAFQDSPDAERIQQAIKYIQARHGVPVVVAAGNSGPDKTNVLSRGAALVAENAVRGTDKTSTKSGKGNILQEASSTSMATALVSAQAAILHRRGWGVKNVVSQLQQEARREGGALN